MGLVWAAGPLAGAFGQSYFGIYSDQCRLPWGKRRPFIVVGAMSIIIFLLALAWVKEIVYVGVRFMWIGGDPGLVQNATLVLATVCIYGLNLAIQPVQGGLRALIVDSCPTNQLDHANAWAARMTGIFNLLCYGIGFVNLPRYLPFLGHTQFQILCLFASASLALTIAATCYSIEERDPSNDGPPDPKLISIAGKLRHVRSSFARMPPQVMRVCKAQFAAWSAWFLFLYYITT